MKQPEREAVLHRSLTLFLTCAALLWSSTCFAVLGELGDNSGSNDNPHNLSSGQSGTTPHATDTTEICIFCHTPHGATPKSTLWNRPDPVGGLPFRVGTLNIDDAGFVNDTHYSAATSAAEGYPNGTSKLCLSCHDGVTAMGILVNGPSITMTADLLTGAAVINLSSSHPISFIYNDTVKNNLNIISPGSYILPGAASGYLEIDSGGTTRVQCTSCHQPHQDTMVSPGNSLPFWRDMTATQETAYDNVCGACHTTNYSATGFNDHNF